MDNREKTNQPEVKRELTPAEKAQKKIGFNNFEKKLRSLATSKKDISVLVFMSNGSGMFSSGAHGDLGDIFEAIVLTLKNL